MDPEAISEMSHASAAALLDRVHHTQDPQVVQRVLTLVDTEGVDIIAELWSDAEADSLPGILWRLYLLRTWIRNNQRSIARLWRLVEPEETTASAIAGVDTPPDGNDIARTADSILSGAFTGDFAMSLDRASAFVEVVAKGLSFEAKVFTRRAGRLEAEQAAEHADRPSTDGGQRQSDHSESSTDDHAIKAGNTVSGQNRTNRYDSALSDADDQFRKGSGPASPAGPAPSDPRTTAARLLHTAGNLMTTARDFHHGADLWRRGQLE
jgi:hypothetical protein